MKSNKNILNVFFTLFLVSGLFLFNSCGNQSKKDLIVGSWKDTSPSALNITLLPDGTAHSDNMQTLIYKKWSIDGNNITFTIESKGNGSSSIDDETYSIQKLTTDELIIKNGDLTIKYTKIKK